MRAVFVLTLFLLGGCAALPVRTAASSGPAPALLPLDDLLAGVEARSAPDPSPALASRAARLKARAALMRGPVHDPETRARLARAIADGRA